MLRRDINQWKLGLFVAIAIFLVMGAFIWLGAMRFDVESFQSLSFLNETVQGLEVGSPVKFRGVPIGNVDDISIAPDGRWVQITSEIHMDEMIRLGLRTDKPTAQDFEQMIAQGIRAQLASAGITGLKYLAVDFFDPATNRPPTLPFETPWNYLPSVPSTLESLEKSLVETLDRFPGLLDDASALINELKAALAAVDAEGLSAGATDLIALAHQKLDLLDMPRLNSLTGEASEALQSIEDLGRQLAGKDGPVYSLLARMEGAIAALEAEVQGARLGETTASMRRSLDSIGDLTTDARGLGRRLDEDLRALQETLAAVRALATMLERDPGALIHGPTPAPQPGGNR